MTTSEQEHSILTTLYPAGAKNTNTWQLFRKYIWVFLNYSNLIQGVSMHLIEHAGLVGSHDCRKLHCSAMFCGQPYCSFGTQDDSVILLQPIHTKDDVYALGIQDDEVC
jgi:hypothetical protein